MTSEGYSGTPLAKKLGIGAGMRIAALRAVLAREAARLRELLGDGAVLWVSWPKKAARVPTDLTEDGIRELVLPLGWVDAKVCAVASVRSGLKLVVRRQLREGARKR